MKWQGNISQEGDCKRLREPWAWWLAGSTSLSRVWWAQPDLARPSWSLPEQPTGRNVRGSIETVINLLNAISDIGTESLTHSWTPNTVTQIAHSLWINLFFLPWSHQCIHIHTSPSNLDVTVCFVYLFISSYKRLWAVVKRRSILLISIPDCLPKYLALLVFSEWINRWVCGWMIGWILH